MIKDNRLSKQKEILGFEKIKNKKKEKKHEKEKENVLAGVLKRNEECQ